MLTTHTAELLTRDRLEGTPCHLSEGGKLKRYRWGILESTTLLTSQLEEDQTIYLRTQLRWIKSAWLRGDLIWQLCSNEGEIRLYVNTTAWNGRLDFTPCKPLLRPEEMSTEEKGGRRHWEVNTMGLVFLLSSPWTKVLRNWKEMSGTVPLRQPPEPEPEPPSSQDLSSDSQTRILTDNSTWDIQKPNPSGYLKKGWQLPSQRQAVGQEDDALKS